MGKQPNTTSTTDRQAKIDAAAKASKQGPNKILIGTVVALVAIIAVVAGVIIADQSTRSSDSGGDAVPAAAGEMGAGFVANPDVTLQPGAPTLDIYEDFRCPACHQAYAVFHPTVTELADEGQVRLVYHFKTVIDGNSGGDASLKAASSAMCAADAGRFVEYHEAILDGIVANGGTQPNWGPEFFSTTAEQVGITGTELEAFDQCVAEGRYDEYIRSTDEQSARDGVNGTPTYRLNGETVDFATVNTPELFVQAVENATE